MQWRLHILFSLSLLVLYPSDLERLRERQEEPSQLPTFKMSPTNGTTHAWASLPQALSQSVSTLNKRLDNDPQWQAFIDTKGHVEPVTIGIQSSGGADAVLVSVHPGAKTFTTTGPASKADFVLKAHPEQWELFFSPNPVSPYTSFVGLQVREPLSLLIEG